MNEKHSKSVMKRLALQKGYKSECCGEDVFVGGKTDDRQYNCNKCGKVCEIKKGKNEIDKFINKIKEVKMYECPICEALHETYDETEQCIIRDFELDDIVKNIEENFKPFNMISSGWCPSCQKGVQTVKQKSKNSEGHFIEIICCNCNRTLNFYEGGII